MSEALTRGQYHLVVVARNHVLVLRDVLEVLHQGDLPSSDVLAWPAGLDRSILGDLSLQVRTWNCLHHARLLEGDGAITVGELMHIRHFGRASLQDFLINVDKYLREYIGTESEEGDAPRDGDLAPGDNTDPTRNADLEASTDISPSPWDEAGRILSPLFAAATELQGAETLADTLHPDLMRLGDKLGIASAISSIQIGDVTADTPRLVSSLLDRLSHFLDIASPNEQAIIEHRLLRTHPMTLEELGSRVGRTRERVRQIQVTVERKLHSVFGSDVRIIASTLKEQLGSMLPQSEVDARITDCLPMDSDGIAVDVLRNALVDEMGFVLKDGMYLDRRARMQLADIRVSIRKLADDVGLVDEQRAVAGLPGEPWSRYWSWIWAHCGLHNLFGFWSIRNSAKARAKAALMSIGRPATREEVSRVCGFGDAKTGSHLSVIPSVVKADKDRWGLREWVDDEYNGIVGEITQRIEEDGGATKTERLLTELPAKFGVHRMSVYAYMQTPKFIIRDDWISIASTSSVRLRDLDDVIDGRDQDGAPYWLFTVESRFLDGYSVTGVPPEFAHALGCRPDDHAHLRIENLPECPELSIRWPLASTTGGSLGYLRKALQKLGLQPGQQARVTIRGVAVVSLSLHENGDDDFRIGDKHHAILDRMINRRKVL